MATLGRYTLLDRVGEGGMAEVFRAQLEGPMGFQKELAIKRIRDTVVRQNGDYVRSLINEARIGGKLRHQNIAEVYELGEEDGAYYIAMEFIEGVPLADLLREARDYGYSVPPNVVLDVAIQVCNGLAYAHNFVGPDGHKLALVHRDLKPSNIMISTGGTAKIVDFGIAKATSNIFHTTNTGIAKGTPLYMSPEQLRGMRPLPSCSDLFSLGAILFEMATGKILFAENTIPQIITRVLSAPLRDDIALAESRIPGLGRILERLLDRDVASRIQSAEAVAIELQHVYEWQERRMSTAQFVQQFSAGELLRKAQAEHERREARRAVGLPTSIELDRPPTEAARTLARFMARRRWRRRAIMAGVLLALLGGAALGGWAIYKGTWELPRGMDSGREALQRGDLADAERAFADVLTERSSLADARTRLLFVRSWSRSVQEDEDLADGKILDLYSSLPEATAQEFVQKYRLAAFAARRRGDSLQALGVVVEALDQADKQQVFSPGLLWDAGELGLMHPRAAGGKPAGPTVGRAAFELLADALPAGPQADAARAWVERIQAGDEALLVAELRWIDGQVEAAWEDFDAAFDAARLSREERRRERLVWAYRALGDERWEQARALLEPLGAKGEPSAGRRAALAGLAAAEAGSARPEAADAQLEALDRAAGHAVEKAAGRLTAARAALLAGAQAGDSALSAWGARRLDEAEDLLPPGDADVRALRTLLEQGRPGPRRWDPAERIGYDARLGRFVPAPLLRAAPGGGTLAPPESFGRLNRTVTGEPSPFGPVFHPRSGEPLPVFFHPGI